jgi:hypothetical protein
MTFSSNGTETRRAEIDVDVTLTGSAMRDPRSPPHSRMPPWVRDSRPTARCLRTMSGRRWRARGCVQTLRRTLAAPPRARVHATHLVGSRLIAHRLPSTLRMTNAPCSCTGSERCRLRNVSGEKRKRQHQTAKRNANGFHGCLPCYWTDETDLFVVRRPTILRCFTKPVSVSTCFQEGEGFHHPLTARLHTIRPA